MLGQDFQHGFVLRGEFHRFDHPDHGIHFAQGLGYIAIEHTVECAAMLGLKTRGIDENVLGVVLREYAVDAVARGLRFFRGDRDFLPDELVHQRGFADVWTANDGNKTRAKVVGEFVHLVLNVF